MSAIATGDAPILNEDVVRAFHILEQVIASVAAEERREPDRRERLHRDDRPAPDVRGRTVILVDDGLATGATMQAAVASLRQHEPARIVVTVPVAAPATCAAFRALVDEVVCAITPSPFAAVGAWYEDFSQTTDAEVGDLLARVAGEARKESGS